MAFFPGGSGMAFKRRGTFWQMNRPGRTGRTVSNRLKRLTGSYKVQRPFVLVTVEGKALSPAAQSFFDYATSPAAADIIAKAGAVAAN